MTYFCFAAIKTGNFYSGGNLATKHFPAPPKMLIYTSYRETEKQNDCKICVNCGSTP